jgi:hypothetical protein
MEGLAEEAILKFLEEVGRRCPQPADLVLLDGSALCLLGSPRPTLDIDYVGDDLTKNELQQCIDQVALDMGIMVEAVPIAGFVPLPEDAEQRKLSVGQFGAVQVYIFDPYSMALSKIDRGFDTDIEDVVFLIQRGFIRFDHLRTLVGEALERAGEFSMSKPEMRDHLNAVEQQLRS